jgi:hypothetical protein
LWEGIEPNDKGNQDFTLEKSLWRNKMDKKTIKQIKEGAKKFVKESNKARHFEGMYEQFVNNAPDKLKPMLKQDGFKDMCNIWFVFGRKFESESIAKQVDLLVKSKEN